MKKMIAMILLSALTLTLFTGCSTEEPTVEETTTEATEEATAEETTTDTVKIAFAVSTLDNEIWALSSTHLAELGAELGYEVTTLSASSNAATQVDQLESCIEAGYDVIALDPVDTAAVEDVCARALEAGIIVVNYGQEFENATTSIVLDEETTGASMGAAAAEWVLENWGDYDSYTVICVGLDTVPVLVTRLESFKTAFQEAIPEAEFVTDINGASAAESMTAGESALQANSNINICLAIGGDQAYGFVQAAIAAGMSEDELVAFAIDATEQSMKMLYEDEYIEGIMSVGSVETKIGLLMDTIQSCLMGEEVPEVTYFDEDWIDDSNIAEKYIEYGYGE